MYERILLSLNDLFVAIFAKNLFFLNKPEEFHSDCTTYARAASALRLGLLLTVGWKALLFLYLSESLWSIPPHPASAMFISNHGSVVNGSGSCIPTSSTYAGRWYSLFTLGTNMHCEHHDFPTIPFHRLHELRKIAPEYYRSGSNDNLFDVMRRSFAKPDYYACMNANELAAPAGFNRD
jgi:fatty acid desaturase